MTKTKKTKTKKKNYTLDDLLSFKIYLKRFQKDINNKNDEEVSEWEKKSNEMCNFIKRHIASTKIRYIQTKNFNVDKFVKVVNDDCFWYVKQFIPKDILERVFINECNIAIDLFKKWTACKKRLFLLDNIPFVKYCHRFSELKNNKEEFECHIIKTNSMFYILRWILGDNRYNDILYTFKNKYNNFRWQSINVYTDEFKLKLIRRIHYFDKHCKKDTKLMKSMYNTKLKWANQYISTRGY
jgi:hypothetical protein